MKIRKTITIEKQDDIVQDIVCNICAKLIPKNEFGYAQDFLEIDKTWGFHSPFDGEAHRFDICLDCYKKLLNDMKIKPAGSTNTN